MVGPDPEDASAKRALLSPTAGDDACASGDGDGDGTSTTPSSPTLSATPLTRVRDYGIDACEMLYTVLACAFFMLVGPMLIMSNKYLLTTAHFSYPLLLTSMHQCSSSFFCTLLVHVLRVVPLRQEVSWADWRRTICVMSAGTTAALCLGISAYLYLTVSFIEILKGFTPVVTIMVQSLFGEPLPSCRIAMAVLMISLGTAISSFGELHLNLTGLILMLLSVYCEATRMVLTQRLLNDMNFHVIEGLYHISPVSAVLAFSIACVLELPKINHHKLAAALPDTWHLFAVNLLLGFCVNGARRRRAPSPRAVEARRRGAPSRRAVEARSRARACAPCGSRARMRAMRGGVARGRAMMGGARAGTRTRLCTSRLASRLASCA